MNPRELDFDEDRFDTDELRDTYGTDDIDTIADIMGIDDYDSYEE